MKRYFSLFYKWQQSTRADFKEVASQIADNMKSEKQMNDIYDDEALFISLLDTNLFYAMKYLPNPAVAKTLETTLQEYIDLYSYQKKTTKKARKNFRNIVSAKINKSIVKESISLHQYPRTPFFKPAQSNKEEIDQIIDDACKKTELTHIKINVVNNMLVHGFFHENTKQSNLKEDGIISMIYKIYSNIKEENHPSEQNNRTP